MADRFQELLSKGAAAQLTSEEKMELARCLNAPMLDALENPPLEFVSKHRMTETDLPARIKAIDWFAKCGEPGEFDLTMEVERVKTWPQAMKACKSRSSFNARLEAGNQLTVALHHCDRQRFREWNKIVERFKESVITPFTTEIWEPFRQSLGLDIKLVHCVQWCILSALMENAYMSSNHGSFFFLELLTVFETGHFPCGWRGEWPQGQLVIF